MLPPCLNTAQFPTVSREIASPLGLIKQAGINSLMRSLTAGTERGGTTHGGLCIAVCYGSERQESNNELCKRHG